MLNRLYILFGGLVLLGYAVSALEGWEFGNPTRQRVPSAYSGRSSGGGWWYYGGSDSSTRSGMGGGPGGK
jgi:hypothetical protein